MVRITWTDHLVGLVDRTASAAARLASVPAGRRAALAPAAIREAARLSVRMDASPLEDATAGEVDRRTAAGLPPTDADRAGSGPQRAAAGWGAALRLEGMADQQVAAVEYANVVAALERAGEAAGLLDTRPMDALVLLHRELVRGLVDEEVAGRLRRTERALLDGAQGRVLYHAPDPEALPGLTGELARWLTRRAGLLPAAVVAGVVEERLLEWQPFEAANGRLARAAARAVLHARGVDPEGLAVPERHLAADNAGYHLEVAATQRRGGELAGWLERVLEAHAAALEDAADSADPSARPPVPARATATLSGLDPRFTLRDYADAAAVPLGTATTDLTLLRRHGYTRPEPGTHGLRHRRTTPDPEDTP